MIQSAVGFDLLRKSNAAADLTVGRAQVIMWTMGNSCKYRWGFSYLPLPSCCVACFLTSHSWYWSRPWGLGTPALSNPVLFTIHFTIICMCFIRIFLHSTHQLLDSINYCTNHMSALALNISLYWNLEYNCILSLQIAWHFLGCVKWFSCLLAQ